MVVYHGEISHSPSIERDHDIAHVILYTSPERREKFTDMQDPDHRGFREESDWLARHQAQYAGVIIEVLINK